MQAAQLVGQASSHCIGSWRGATVAFAAGWTRCGRESWPVQQWTTAARKLWCSRWVSVQHVYSRSGTAGSVTCSLANTGKCPQQLHNFRGRQHMLLLLSPVGMDMQRIMIPCPHAWKLASGSAVRLPAVDLFEPADVRHAAGRPGRRLPHRAGRHHSRRVAQSLWPIPQPRSWRGPRGTAAAARPDAPHLAVSSSIGPFRVGDQNHCFSTTALLDQLVVAV